MNDDTIETLVDLDDIAKLYRCSRWQARDHIVKLPGFPPIVPGASWKKPLWLASDVRKFLRSAPQKSPKEPVSA